MVHVLCATIMCRCDLQETSILRGEFVKLFQEVIHHQTSITSVTFICTYLVIAPIHTNPYVYS